MSHYDALKKLFPVDLGDISDMDMAIEGDILDKILTTIETGLLEISPATAIRTLSRWEKEYAPFVKPTDEAARRNAVIARMRELASSTEGSLRKAVFVSIADALGYQIEIVEAPEMFRAGISKAGDAVYSISLLWVMTVVVIGASEAPDLEELFDDIVPPHLRIDFEYV